MFRDARHVMVMSLGMTMFGARGCRFCGFSLSELGFRNKTGVAATRPGAVRCLAFLRLWPPRELPQHGQKLPQHGPRRVLPGPEVYAERPPGAGFGCLGPPRDGEGIYIPNRQLHVAGRGPVCLYSSCVSPIFCRSSSGAKQQKGVRHVQEWLATGQVAQIALNSYWPRANLQHVGFL